MTLRHRRPSILVKNMAIALIALMIGGPAFAETPKTAPAAAPGGLSIATDPVGAAVYVDGRPAGTTPVNIGSIAPGDHRVRVVKTGYLENARVVTVAAGRATPVMVKLTKSSEAAGQVTSTGGSSGGGGGLLSNKFFWIGVAGAGAATAFVLATRNSAPIPGTITAPANALMATSVSFSSQGASDKDGDPLTLTWNFGDGGTATGAQVTHTFATAGSFTVKLTVSDGKKQVDAPSATVNIRSLSATWSGPLRGSTTTFNSVVTLTQSGTSLSGSYRDQTGTATVSGSINPANGAVTFTCTATGFAPWVFTGTTNSDITQLNGVANGSGFVSASWTMTRS